MRDDALVSDFGVTAFSSTLSLPVSGGMECSSLFTGGASFTGTTSA